MSGDSESNRRIPDQAVENLLTPLIFTVVWNIASIVVVGPIVKAGIEKHELSRLLALAFPAIGLGLIVWAVRRVLRIRKFGQSVFDNSPVAPSPGGDLSGTIHVQRAVEGDGPVTLRLTCVRRIIHSGEHSSSTEHVIWQEEQAVNQLPPTRDGTDIPVLFQIPSDASPSDDSDMRNQILWRLEARCKTSGVHYLSRFEIPVRMVAQEETTGAARRQAEAIPQPLDSSISAAKISERGINLQPLAGSGVRITLRAARNKPWFVTIVGLVFWAIALFIATLDAPVLMRIILISIASIPTFFGAILLYIAVYTWFVRTEVIVRHGTAILEHRALLIHWQRTLQAREIDDIFVKVDSKSSRTKTNGQTTESVTYGVQAKLKDGRPIWLANDIFHQDYAAWLARQIRQNLGLQAI